MFNKIKSIYQTMKDLNLILRIESIHLRKVTFNEVKKFMNGQTVSIADENIRVTFLDETNDDFDFIYIVENYDTGKSKQFWVQKKSNCNIVFYSFDFNKYQLWKKNYFNSSYYPISKEYFDGSYYNVNPFSSFYDKDNHIKNIESLMNLKPMGISEKVSEYNMTSSLEYV